MNQSAEPLWHFVRTDSGCEPDAVAIYTEHFKCAAVVFFSLGAILQILFPHPTAAALSLGLQRTGMARGLSGTAQTQKLKCF